MPIKHQVHDKFKVFTGKLAEDHTLGSLADDVAKFTQTHKVAAKSIGVAYLEHSRNVLITLGYRDDVDGYPVSLKVVHLGHVDVANPDHTDIEKKMAKASDKVENVVCHELYVTENDDVYMVFLIHG